MERQLYHESVQREGRRPRSWKLQGFEVNIAGAEGYRKLYLAFVDLEKAFDRVPRKVLWWAMRVVGFVY